MKTLAILLIGTTVFMAGCACDCEDKLGTNADGTEMNTDKAGVYIGTDLGSGADVDNNGNGTANATSGNHNGNHNGTSNGNGNGNGNTGGTQDGSNLGGAIDATEANDGSNIKPKNDPRKYEQSGTGVGYRADTLDEYDGIDGSARDKGPMDEVPGIP